MAVKTRTPGLKETLKALPDYYLALEANPPDFTIIGASTALIDRFGLSEVRIIGRPLTEAFFRGASSEWQKELSKSLTQVVEIRTAQGMRAIELPVANRQKRLWRLINHPVLGPDGAVQCIIQSLHDATDRVAVGGIVGENRSSLYSLADAMPNMVWIIDGDGRPPYYNKQWREYVNLSEEAIASFDWSNIVHPDDIGRVMESWHRSQKTGKAFETELRLLHPTSKTYHWFMSQARPSRSTSGTITRWFGTCIDIDEQKRAAQISNYLSQAAKELASSLDYAKTLDTVTRLSVPEIADWCSVDLYNEAKDEWEQVAISHTDRSKVELARRYRELNPIDTSAATGVPAVVRSGKAEFYPYIGEEALEKMVDDPEDLAFAKEVGIRAVIIAPIFVKGKARGAITFVSSDPNRQYSLSDLQMAEEMASRISLSITNATLYQDSQAELERRQQLEGELLQEKNKLEQRVKARTRQLEEANKGLQAEVERRREAETELKRSNQELQDFAYVASHDLQEPLRKIQAFGDILESEYGKRLDDGAEYLKRMHAAASRMSQLIEDLLAFSRVTTRPPAPDKVDLNKVVYEVLGDLEDQVSRTAGRVDVGKLPVVLADPTHMRQLLQNLISNALKFHREDVPPVVTVSARPCKETECTYEITIADNGIGFDQKYTDRIFGVFQRLHGRDSYEGTGIGLAVCRKIVERYGGTITAESQRGKGAKFIIKIPTATKEKQRDD